MADVHEGRERERSFGDNGRKDGSRGERGGRDARNREGQGGSRGGGSHRGEGRGRDGDRRRDGGRGRGEGRNGRRGDGRRGEGRGRDGDRRRGRGGVRHDRSNPRREGFREDRMAQKEQEPDLPQGLEISDLDPSVLQDLKVLSKDNAERVAKHMLMATDLLYDDPKLALQHARAAKNRAGRVGVVRETNGVVAYHAGEWKEALSELRAARRISGGPGLLAVMADAERGLGRPEKALELGRSPEARELDEAGQIELAIVLAGARHDLGQHESAVAQLQRLNPSLDSQGFEQARLSYAYADALLATGEKAEAKRWFEHVAKIDVDGMTDASERVAELG
nr:hypothetical protein [Corynebacterium afermentans]